jgi:two-component system nitrogen regulation response regulator NtrX
VAEGRVREDLYFRLNVVPIVAPPLRERPGDVPLLAEAFLAGYCSEYGVPLKSLSPGTVDLLVRYPWPGNVRELKNQVERMVIMSPGRLIEPRDLCAEIRTGHPAPAENAAARPAGALHRCEPVELLETPRPSTITPGDREIPSLQEAKWRFERDMIQTALDRNGWNVSKTAEELGLERTNLHKKIKTFGLSKGSP